MNLSKYRLNSENELKPYIEKYGWEFYKGFLERTYSGLIEVKEYDVTKVKKEHREMFIKTVCILILAFGLKAYFNEGFTKITINDNQTATTKKQGN